MTGFLRRTFLLGAGALSAAASLTRAQAQTNPQTGSQAAPAAPIDLHAELKYPFVLPPLPYAYEANEASIDATTMHLHHDKHHAAYVSNLNAALKDHTDLQAMTLRNLLLHLGELPESVRTVVRNNAGGHANHTMFWQVMGGHGGEPTGDVGAAITRDFGSFAAFKTAFNAAGTKVFGSGWAMVASDREGHLTLIAKPNQDTPLMDGQALVFGNDVWEHAYYLKYQNRRPDYLGAWWNVIDWQRVNDRYAAAKAGTLSV